MEALLEVQLGQGQENPKALQLQSQAPFYWSSHLLTGGANPSSGWPHWRTRVSMGTGPDTQEASGRFGEGRLV